MAITGIDTIDGKQIIAAGAISAKSAEMAYNDENGNPITGYLTAVPEGYATTGDLTAYQTTAGMTAYQEAGDYLSANALDDVSGDWNRISALSGYSANGWSVSPTAGRKVFADKVLFSPQAGQTLTAYLGVYSPGANTASDVYTYIADGSIYFYNRNRSNSAQFIRPDTIVKWNNYASGKLDTTATANFYTTANESGFISEVPTGTMNESNFGYDGSDNITGYNGSAIGGGSAPTYGYTDNGLISSIDSSGLYAKSALESKNANTVKDHGTLGYDLSSYLSQNASYFYWMPSNSPWTTADYATGIFSPLQYATGACLAMNNPATFKAYYKGNEWFVSNTVSNVGQMLRGEVHKTRGVHISGATTAGYGFDLNISGVSGKDSNGEWRYGYTEDAALRAVSSCNMHESAFGYDANDKISGYNGSAFAGGGGEFPQSATEAIETVTANSADWNETTETVSSNSGAWGGEALPISAGPGIKFEMVDNTLVASTDETVLYENYSGRPTATGSYFDLSESPLNFEYVEVYLNGSTPSGNNNIANGYEKIPNYQLGALGSLEFIKSFAGVLGNTSTIYEMGCGYSGTSGTRWTKWFGYSKGVNVTGADFSNAGHLNIWKVVGINRIAGV